MKTTRAAKDARRAKRGSKSKARSHRDDPTTLHVLGGTMDPDVYERVLRAARRTDFGGPWESTAPMILPVLKRVRHPYPPELSPMHMLVPPGIWTGFGIDFGPAFSHVTASMIEGWGIDQATLLGTALENLRRLVVDEPPDVQPFEVQGRALIGVQGQGWGSSLLLLPEVLRPLLGPEPRTLLAPVRNTLIALPEDADLELAVSVWDALADGAHDELDVDPMRWNGATVVAIGDESSGLPN